MNALRAAASALALVVCANAAADGVPGSTAAYTAQVDIAVWLMRHFHEAHGCLTAQVLNAEHEGDPSTKTERWTVTHCGVVTSHVVSWRADPEAEDWEVSTDEALSQVVLPKANYSCKVGERKSDIKAAKQRLGEAEDDVARVAASLGVLIHSVGCYPRPLRELQNVGSPVVELTFSRDGKLLTYRLWGSSENVLMDAEARFLWRRIAVRGLTLKVPKSFRPGEEQLRFRVPLNFRAH